MKPKNFDDLYEEAETSDDYWLAGAVQDFTEKLFELMEQEGVHRSELARRLGTSPAYITKILRGNANFTLATMVRLARALRADLSIQLTPATSRDRNTEKSSKPSKQSTNGRDSRPSTELAIAAAPPDR